MYPQFILDFDEPASTRYNELFVHFEDDLRVMETYWWDYIGHVPAYQDFFRDNLDEFKELHADMYEASLALASFLDLPVS